MPLPMLDWAWAKKNRLAPLAVSAAPRARTSRLSRPEAGGQAAQRGARRAVQEQEGADDDDDVADAEDVVDRQPARGVEDVAQEAERRAVGGRRVRELRCVLRDAGGRDGVRVGGHDAAVADDGGEVERPAGGDHQQAGDAAVDDEEGAEQRVGGEVDLLAEASAAPGQHGDDQHLDDQGGDREPRVAELELAEAGQSSTHQGHGQDAEEQRAADQHTRDIDASGPGLEPETRPAARTNVQSPSSPSQGWPMSPS